MYIKIFYTLSLSLFFSSIIVSTDLTSPWDRALNNYLQAYALCPDHIEPLVLIARHYIEQGSLETAFIFARRACEQAVPEGIMCDTRLYTYDRYELLSACALSLREWKLGIWAVKEALKVEPKSDLLHERLCYYHEQVVIEAGRAITITD